MLGDDCEPGARSIRFLMTRGGHVPQSKLRGGVVCDVVPEYGNFPAAGRECREHQAAGLVGLAVGEESQVRVGLVRNGTSTTHAAILITATWLLSLPPCHKSAI
jgi:hypothetical protein